MAVFAQGTSQAAVDAYYQRMPRSLGGMVPDEQHPAGIGRQQGFGAPAGRYAAGTSPATAANRPDWLPSYRPGQAQPKAPPAQGTPYGAYAPGPAANRPQNKDTMQPAFSGGNMAYANPGMRPPPFTASYQGFDGSVSNQPNFAQRDAFINQITGQLGQMQNQSWQQPTGAPQFNFPGMWNQAGKMVQQGWQNPMAQFGQSPSPVFAGGQQPQGRMPGMHDSDGDGVDDRLRNISPGIPRGFSGQSPPGYGGTPGTNRTADFRDRDGDGVDDRDQAGPGQSPYGGARPGKNFNPRNYNRPLGDVRPEALLGMLPPPPPGYIY